MSHLQKGQIGPRFFVYFVGLLVMSLGVVMLIVADLGVSAWDVFHIGLHYQLGLTIGSWSIIVGIMILTIAALIAKEFPKSGAFINMVSVGLFMDFYLLFLQTPHTLTGKIIMFIGGLFIYCYGMGIYISARLGTGPRDSLMMAITSRTGWKVGPVRTGIEVVVLIIGWQLGGPVFWGTIIVSIIMGPILSFALPQCQTITDRFLTILKEKKKIKIAKLNQDQNRGVS